jgi:WD40 repeat protein
VEAAFIGVGCNRVVGAVAWGPCNLVAFAAHHVVAIFSPQTAKVLATLPGHKDLVNCVEWILCQQRTHSDSCMSMLIPFLAVAHFIFLAPISLKEELLNCGNL